MNYLLVERQLDVSENRQPDVSGKRHRSQWKATGMSVAAPAARVPPARPGPPLGCRAVSRGLACFRKPHGGDCASLLTAFPEAMPGSCFRNRAFPEPSSVLY